MKHLSFKVNGQSLLRLDGFKPATGSSEYLTASFEFTSDWSGTTKTAKCRVNSAIYDAVISSDACVIPWEVLVIDKAKQIFGKQCFYIWVEGVNGKKTITTNEIKIELDVQGSGEEKNASEPTPSVYAQFVEDVKAETKASADTATAQAESATASAESAAASAVSLKNDYSNALKGNASGAVVRVDDVSPVEHNPKARVVCPEGVDPSTVKVTRCGKNQIKSEKITNEQWKNAPQYSVNGVTWSTTETREIAVVGETSSGNYAVFDIATGERFTEWLVDGETYIASLNQEGAGDIDFVVDVIDKESGAIVSYINNGTVFVVNKNKYRYGTFRLQITPNKKVDAIVKPQIEVGDKATDFEAYKSEEYAPNTDGTVEGLTSTAPTMTLLTDTDNTVIECEYNRDINKVIADIITQLAGG